MSETIEETIERLVRGWNRRVHRDSTWIHVTPTEIALPAHGWKLHVSSTLSGFPDLVATLVPILLESECAFKLAGSAKTLSDLNDALDSPASVGKAFTIYPDPQRVRDLGLRLTDLLRGRPGPRVLSDRRIDESAPVYYRYGPFTAGWSADSHGRIGVFLHGPDGERFEGEAGTTYQQPSWAVDPFAMDTTTPDVDDGLSLSGGRYRVTSGVYESARGNIFRATDTASGDTVIVKQARAMVAESADGTDARLRLRNERRILQAADGVGGIPRFLDHFQHVDDEFLVITDLGPENLVDRILRDGPYDLDDLAELARSLARIVHALHERGIVMRDIASKNVVLGPSGEIGLVDFGISAYDGIHLPGATPGFSLVSGDIPVPVDDHYALGMTLINATTGVSPVVLDGARWSRIRALQAVQRRYGAEPPGLVATIVELVDPSTANAAFERLVATDLADHRPVPAPTLPALPVVDETLVDTVTSQVLEEVLRIVDAMTTQTTRRPDASVYTGTAGIGLELAHHAAHPDVPARLERLTEITTMFAERASLGPGLFLGGTGVRLFLDGVAEIPASAFEPMDEYDLISGSVGVGLAHLWSYAANRDPRHVDLARRHAESIVGDPRGGSLAHGLAGVILLDLKLMEHDESRAVDVENGLAELIPRTEDVIARAATHSGDPLMTVSWCNGLTGMAHVLFEAGRRLDRKDCTAVAVRAGEALATWTPRMEAIGQCCGTAGMGDLFVDLAQVEERFREYALDAARHLLLRSAGPPERPEFVNPATQNVGAWSGGLSGVLGFLRRLRDGGGPRLLPDL